MFAYKLAKSRLGEAFGVLMRVFANFEKRLRRSALSS